MTLDELLTKCSVDKHEYIRALKESDKGTLILLKRQPNECFVDNYNSAVMLAWQANMDLQFVLNAYACVMYIVSYITKTDKAMGELLRKVAMETRTEELNQQLRQVGNAFLTHRELSAQECVYRVLSMPLKQLSRVNVYIDTNTKNDRVAVLKPKEALDDLHEDDTDVFQKSFIDRYSHRPQIVQCMCLAEFAASYNVDYCDKHQPNDVLPEPDDNYSPPQLDHNTANKPLILKLTEGYGSMKLRKREAIIRFRKYNREAEPTNWYRAKLMLYFPWYNEQSDLLGGYSTYQEHFHHVQRIVLHNEAKYTKSDLEEIDFNDLENPEHAWHLLAPSTESSTAHLLSEHAETLTNVSPEDLRDYQQLAYSSTSTRLGVRFESAANIDAIAPDEYRQLLRGLNDEQRDVVMFHRKWCKEAVLSISKLEKIKPYRLFMSGPGGVGKSHIIRIIHSDTIKLLKQSGYFEPDDVVVLLTAPTGVAAFNINGMTLHSAFSLGTSKYGGIQRLKEDKSNTLQNKLGRLQLLIIDEVSMVGAIRLLEINQRLQQIKRAPINSIFGGVSILAVGDFYQLPPVSQSPLYHRITQGYAQFYGSGSLWIDQFQMVELAEIMRQRGDLLFCELLCRVRTASCTPADIATLKSRQITTDDPDYPTHALHVYKFNADVDKKNSEMLNILPEEVVTYTVKAYDTQGGQTSHIDLTKLSNNRNETGGLHTILKLAVGARVMLTVNIDVSDGLVNGARGEVVHVVTNNNVQVSLVLVKFDSIQVGQHAIQLSTYRNIYRNAVPIQRQQVVFFAKGKRGSEITRLQFPLTLAWATTIHKVQGLTLDEIVVNMKGGRFTPGQAYVAFSRV